MIIHEQDIPEGHLVVYSDGDYSIIEGDVYSVDSPTAYYRRGHGPDSVERIVDRVYEMYLVSEGIRRRREEARVGDRGTSDRGTGERGVRAPGLTSEDEDMVPLPMRSSTSRFRMDLRLSDPATRDEELLRREIAVPAYQLGQELGSYHAYLQFLIDSEGHLSRFRPLYGTDSGSGAGAPRMAPTNLALAIYSGEVIERASGELVIADLTSSSNIISTLQAELPGFSGAYDSAFANATRGLWAERFAQQVLDVIDAVTIVYSLLSGFLRSAALRTFISRLERAAFRAQNVSIETLMRSLESEAAESGARRLGSETASGLADDGARAVERLATEESDEVVEGAARAVDEATPSRVDPEVDADIERSIEPGSGDYDRGVDRTRGRRARGRIRTRRPDGSATRLAAEEAALEELERTLTADQLRAARRLVGRRLNSRLRRLWRSVMSDYDREQLREVRELLRRASRETNASARRALEREAYEIARDQLYPRVARNFWNAVRTNPRMAAMFEDAGMTLRDGRVPAWILPDGREVRMSLEHMTRVADDPLRAVDPDNFILSPAGENSDLLEGIRGIAGHSDFESSL